jgi:choline transport protein
MLGSQLLSNDRAPTAGGQYHWVSEFAPRRHQKLLSYLSGVSIPIKRTSTIKALIVSKGWFSTICWQSIVVVDAQIVGLMIQGLISLNNGDYVPARWQATLIIFASVIAIGMFNVFGAKHLPLAEGIFVTCHLVALLPIIIILLVLAPKQSASAVFTEFTDNGSNYPTIVWTVFVGQVNAMFTVLGESCFRPARSTFQFTVTGNLLSLQAPTPLPTCRKK